MNGKHWLILVACAMFLLSSTDIRAQGGGITYTFSNPGAINISGGPAAAAPYPSQINVSNVPTQLAKVTITLNSMSHTFPGDLDILIVGPQGQMALIMSDVGGTSDMVQNTITLDDASPNVMTQAGPIPNGTYKPTNLGVGDVLPAPAPSNNGSSVLSVFAGTNPNGVWRLFVYDDAAIDSGGIASGWTLTLTAAISGQNTGTISIPASGAASPYPSDIEITNHIYPVSRMLVTLTNFSHASPDDVDIILVSPSGRSVVLMSDVGGANPVSNLNLSFDDNATTTLPDSGALVSGTYRPTDFDPGDAFPAPAPATPTGRMLSSLHGSVADGTWKLYVVDDSGNSPGEITGGWNILIGTTQGAINIAGAGVATPYPSEFVVSGMPGNTTRVTVTLSNFSHLAADDMDMMLVGPDDRRIVLMSDAGGTSEVGSLNLVFDDAAAVAIPDDAALTSGTYRPADYEPGEIFPAPAPTGAVTGNTLNAFYGGAPNGIWRLYIVNENGTSFGSIAGTWSLTVQSSPSACLVTVNPPVQAFPVAGGNSSFAIGQPNGCVWTASTTDPWVTINSGTSGAGNGIVTFTVAPNQGPARTGSIEVTNGVAIRSFQIQQASGCPLSVNQSTLNFPASGGAGNVSVSAGSVCTWQGSTDATWIQITSQPQTGDGTLVFNVQPNPTRLPRAASINVGDHVININQAPLRTAAFDFDGDTRTDVSIFRPPTGVWWIMLSGSPGTVTADQFGISTDKIVPADYDGDLKTDLAVFRNGTWYVLKSSDGTAVITGWGTPSDKPVPADYDRDGSAELAVWRPATGTWWILNPNGTFSSTAFGLDGDIPTPGDYDGDGKTDLSVYRGSTGVWWIFNSSNGAVIQHAFGIQGDIPIPADFDGDGRDNVAVYRPSTGVWYRSLNAAQNYNAVQWGIAGDRPVAGDYDGDGKADPAVFRSGVWYILGSTSGSQSISFGVAGDVAVPER